MTTTAPDGAYIVGGGEWHFGQTMTEDLARAAFEFPMPTLSNMLDLLQTILAQLPFDALKPFKDFLGLADADFASVAQAVEAIMNSLQQRPLFVTVQELVKAITGLANGDLTQLADWFKSNVIDQIADLFTKVNDLFSKIIDFITNNDLIQAINKLIEDIVKAITGLLGKDLAFLATWFADNIKNILDKVGADLQTLINGIVSAFGGVGATVAAAVTAVTNWVQTGPFKQLWDMVQFLIDGIKNLVLPGVDIGSGVQGAIDMIGAILGVGKDASSAAAQAKADIEAIRAGQAGGFSDDFEYPLATSLSATDWQKKTTLPDTYGPNGAGSAVGVMAGTGTGEIRYVQISKPLSTPDMKVTAVLSRNPWWDALVKSGWYLMVQCNSTNRECYSVEIMNDQCQFQMISTTGAVAKLGAAIQIPANAPGVPYTFEIKGDKLSLIRNGILAASYSSVVPLTGRMVGFGGFKSAYVNATDNPLAQYAGITWAPA